MMFLALGIFLMPKQIFAASSKTEMECCKKETSEKKSCHKQQKDDCKHESNQHQNCSGDCCNKCNGCNTVFVPFDKSSTLVNDIPSFSHQEKETFTYRTPHLSTGLEEIWQPPKIG